MRCNSCVTWIIEGCPEKPAPAELPATSHWTAAGQAWQERLFCAPSAGPCLECREMTGRRVFNSEAARFSPPDSAESDFNFRLRVTTMNIQYRQSPRFSATGVTTGSILALIIAMAISVVLDVPSPEASARTTAAHTLSAHA
jgi:hypothetical protein